MSELRGASHTEAVGVVMVKLVLVAVLRRQAYKKRGNIFKLFDWDNVRIDRYRG